MRKNKAAGHMIILAVGTLLTALLNFATQFMLAKHMSPSDFGIFSSAFYLTMTVAPLCGFGIPQFWLKAFGSEGWGGVRFLIPGLTFTLFTTSIIIIVLSGWFLYTEYYHQKLLFLLSFIVLSQVLIELLGAVYQLEENYMAVSVVQTSVYILRFCVLIIICLVFNEVSINNISAGYALISVLMVIVTYGVLKRLLKKDIYLKGHAKKELIKPPIVDILEMIKESAIFGISGVFYMVYYQVNIVLVKYFISTEDAGYYSVAFLFISAAILFPTVIYQKYLLPKLHRWAYQDVSKLKIVYKYGNILMFLFGVIITCIIYFLSPFIISFLFGQKYIDAVELIQLMAISIPIIYLASNSGAILVTKDNMRAKVKIMSIASIISLISFFLFYKHIGVYAGVLATILSNLFICVAYNYKSIVFLEASK
ncbi:oligosaccharide flippase family protein [Citrobacter telavivensis]|uniref:oligosaccharide flippase family protein n=1 Tax=Citrobacter telavivensis TaxID=2653932 RepID=UPI00359CF4B8